MILNASRIVLLLLIATAMVGEPVADSKPVVHTFDAQGVKIRYLTAGETGSTVVLLHGLFLNADLNWRRTGAIEALAAAHRVVAIDFPGHGGSDSPESEAAYGRQMSENLALLLDHLNVDKAHIVGYSMGGMVAMRFVADHPERCLSGVIGGMGWMQDGGPQQQFWQQLPASQSSIISTTLPRSLAKLALTEDELRGIDLPMTVIMGEHDLLWQRSVEPLRRVRADWPIITIEGAGHLSCVVRQDFIDAVVRTVKDS